MARNPMTSAAILALLLAAVTCSEPMREPLEALELDDLCAADPAHEECGASFRQLRGLQVRTAVDDGESSQLKKKSASDADPAEEDDKEEEVAKEEGIGKDEEEVSDDDDDDDDEADEGSASAGSEEEGKEEKAAEGVEDEEPGVCCFSAENPADTCGTCYPTAIATDPQCSRKSQCGGCGGTWCRSVCAMGAADPNDKCGTAFETGLAAPGSYCAKGPETCSSCNGEWCMRGVKKSKEEDTGEAQTKALGAVAGFCCYRAEEDDACGACADVATDVFCSTKGNCGTCGGTWCEGPKCIIGFAKEDNPCGSAWPEGGLAGPESFCSHSEEACSKCSGAWCRDSAIKYVGEKSVPDNTPSSDATDPHDYPGPETPPHGVAPPMEDDSSGEDDVDPDDSPDDGYVDSPLLPDNEDEWDMPDGDDETDSDTWDLAA